MKVVTRFAPSPTGSGLHIGGVRTALFNYLYARKHGGEFRLRIEDTDAARNTPETVQAIHDGLSWLGLDVDGSVVSQMANASRHVEVVETLMGKGLAYRCYLSNEEAKAMKVQGEAFRSPYRDPTTLSMELQQRLVDGSPFVIRFKGPTEGQVIINDKVRGTVSFESSLLDDLVILRSDGTPTYNLAVVVDDHDMGITHVIRGDDHLSNTPKQVLIYWAMGWEPPVFAHIPLIHDESGKKLSKRTGTAVTLSRYADLGYTPEGVTNYLCRLGWGHGDDEVFTREQVVEWFDFDGIVSSPARIDLKKLNSISNWHIRNMDDHELAKRIGLTSDDEVRAISCIKAGSNNLNELSDQVKSICHWTGVSDEAQIVIDESKEVLESFLGIVGDLNSDVPMINNEIIKEWVNNNKLSMKKVGPPVRAALTGVLKAPDLGSLVYILGSSVAYDRIKSQCSS